MMVLLIRKEKRVEQLIIKKALKFVFFDNFFRNLFTEVWTVIESILSLV